MISKAIDNITARDSFETANNKICTWLSSARQEDLFPMFCMYIKKISARTFKTLIEAGMKFDEKICVNSLDNMRNLGRIAYLYITLEISEQIPVYLLNFKVICSAVTWPRKREQEIMLKYIEKSGWYQNDLLCRKIYVLGINDNHYDLYFRWSVKNNTDTPGEINKKCGNINALMHFHKKKLSVITTANREYNMEHDCKECVEYIDKFLK